MQKENLIDYVTSNPRGMMTSVEVMYALIQYAKQRHGTTDLSKVSIGNIFMSNDTAAVAEAVADRLEEK